MSGEENFKAITDMQIETLNSIGNTCCTFITYDKEIDLYQLVIVDREGVVKHSGMPDKVWICGVRPSIQSGITRRVLQPFSPIHGRPPF